MEAEEATISVEDYKNAMRHVASSVAVVTYRDAAGWAGQTTTAICSATTEPPTLVVCIRADSPAAAQIRETGVFAVNFLTDAQAGIARRFSTSGQAERPPFDARDWSEGAGGVPILHGATSSFECRVESSFAHGVHALFLGRVQNLRTAPGENLLYRDGFFRRLFAE